jgi:FKBP-type peptidyl-prolyl cis-trans isomerase SlyD
MKEASLPNWVKAKGSSNMSESPQNIDQDVVVRLQYDLLLDDGENVDQATMDDPLEYIHGISQILPGLQQELTGMVVGEEKVVVLEPGSGFGEKDAEGIVKVPRNEFPPDFPLELGNTVSMTNRETEHELVAQIVDIQPETVTLDFNHPLAGERLHFHVKILDLRHPTAEELEHRHVHGDGHAH